ncbi:unnamed protein product, partial [Mesorhabditis belari]|uniref:Uncharacterized protein n=1 Tax=Mesorhabditis belari TaxID=2138241 RepID=A0AAF3E8G0_9BILA
MFTSLFSTQLDDFRRSGLIGLKVDRSLYGGSNIEIDYKCNEANDNKDYIQFEYEDAGYQTIFAVDYFTDLWAYLDCIGFKNRLATHQHRPFDKHNHSFTDAHLLKKHLRDSSKCGELYQHALRFFELFLNSYKGTPKMGILWTNEAHADEKIWHNSDEYYVKLLRENKEQLDDSFVIIMGDHGRDFQMDDPFFRLMGEHGKRFDMPTGSRQGPFENTNILMLFSIPKRLRNTQIDDMIRKNSVHLFTHHDLHATLIDIIRHQPLAQFNDQSFLKINGTLGNSWLRELDRDLPRDCRHLPIPSQFCPCNYGKEANFKEEAGELKLNPRVFTRINKYGSTADCLFSVPDLVLHRPECYCNKQKS